MQPPKDHNPLTQEHLDTLNQVLQMVPQTAALIAKLRAAGWDVEQAEKENDQHRDVAAALKRNFFPQAP